MEVTHDGATYSSRLTLSPLRYTDTGQFTCSDNSTNSSNNESTVYVYVYGKMRLAYIFIYGLSGRNYYESLSFVSWNCVRVLDKN